VRTRQTTQRARNQEFDAARLLTDEDVTRLGEQIERFDSDVRLDPLDADALLLRSEAVEAHESARRALSVASTAAELRGVTSEVAAGWQALGSLRARVAGQAPPDHRLVCFFDPQHGLSTTDLVWNRPGHGERRVPACSQDAQRLADGLQPQVRLAQVGARRAPYWTAGEAFRAYARGYFSSAPTLSWALMPEVADAAAGSGGPGHFGSGIVGSSGHFDGGGFDGSGAPS
jgi:hypothetical protein